MTFFGELRVHRSPNHVSCAAPQALRRSISPLRLRQLRYPSPRPTDLSSQSRSPGGERRVEDARVGPGGGYHLAHLLRGVRGGACQAAASPASPSSELVEALDPQPHRVLDPQLLAIAGTRCSPEPHDARPLHRPCRSLDPGAAPTASPRRPPPPSLPVSATSLNTPPTRDALFYGLLTGCTTKVGVWDDRARNRGHRKLTGGERHPNRTSLGHAIAGRR